MHDEVTYWSLKVSQLFIIHRVIVKVSLWIALLFTFYLILKIKFHPKKLMTMKNSDYPTFHIKRAHKEHFENFVENYDIERIIVCPDSAIRVWKPKNKRICRFCSKGYPETTFKNDAHHIPQFLGNKHLIFQEECDFCNSKFSSYESHLASYLSMSSTVQGQKGKNNKVPKFKSNDGLVGEQREYHGVQGITIERGGAKLLDLDIDSGEIKLEFTRPTYIPIKAYKALLKIAATSIYEKDVNDYQILFKALANEEYDGHLSGMANVMEYWMPFSYGSPIVYLFRRRLEEANLPTHIFMMYFGRQVLQFVVPGCIKDGYMHEEKEISVIYCPPMSLKPIEHQEIRQKMLDFSRMEKVVGEKGVVILKINPEIIKNLVAYDLIKRKQSDVEFDPSSITKIIIGKDGDRLKLPIDDENLS